MRALRSHFRWGVMILGREGGTRAGGIAQPGWEQTPVCLALADGAKELALADVVGETSPLVPAELCPGSAGFRERTCERLNMSWGPPSRWPRAGRRNGEVSHRIPAQRGGSTERGGHPGMLAAPLLLPVRLWGCPKAGPGKDEAAVAFASHQRSCSWVEAGAPVVKSEGVSERTVSGFAT